MGIRTLIIFLAYTTAAAPTGRKMYAIGTERVTCSLPFTVAGVTSRNKSVDELPHG